MVGGVRLRGRERGGIAALARVIRDNGDSLDYDLMTRTGRCLSEWLALGETGQVAVCHFIRHMGAGGALWRAEGLHRDYATWDTTLATNKVLTELYDLIDSFRFSYVSANSKHKPKRPKPYPAPWAPKGESVKYGKEPVKVSKFAEWWSSRKRKKGGGDGGEGR